MFIGHCKPLLDWGCLEDRPSLRTLKALLASIPDAELLEGLGQRRGQQRNEDPLCGLWGLLILRIALRHGDFESTLERLGHNAQLRRMIGIDEESPLPKAGNISRFLDLLGQEPHLVELRRTFDRMVQKLAFAVPDFGQYVAADTTPLKTREKGGHEEIAEEVGELPQPAKGRKEYADNQGRVLKIFEWFGYQLHLLVDTKHQVVLSYQLTSPEVEEGELLPALLFGAQKNLPVARIRTLTFDKAVDTDDLRALVAKEEIKPLFQISSRWEDRSEQWLPCDEGTSNLVIDEAGALHCYDRTSKPIVRRPMADLGYEAQWDTIKYRCPARQEGWNCPHDAACNAGHPRDRTVHVARAMDLRHSSSIGRTTKTFERMYGLHTCTQRVNARLKIFWGADDGKIAGARRFHAFIGAVMIVHVAFATLLLAGIPRHEPTHNHRHLRPSEQALAGTG